MKKKKIFWCSAPPKWEIPHSGDADFIEQMVKILQKNGVESEWVKGTSKWNGKDIYDDKTKAGAVNNNIVKYIKNNTPDGCESVLNLTIRPPETGCMLSPDDLEFFKDNGIRVVVTCHEYTLNTVYISNRVKHNNTALRYFSKADEVVFLNKSCYDNAIKDLNKKSQAELGTGNQLKAKSHICPIPVTVPVKPSERQKVDAKLKRDPNILVFGNFRRLKGFEEACRAAVIASMIKKGQWDTKLPPGYDFKKDQTLAEYLQNPDDNQKTLLKDQLQKTKVIFAGSVNPDFPEVYKMILKTLRDFPDSVEVYPDPTQIMGVFGKCFNLDEVIGFCDGKNYEQLKKIKDQYSISGDDLTKLAQRCKYAYKGDQTGMRDNASAIISTLDQGCVTYGSNTKLTDACYKSGGKYHNALALDATTKSNSINPGYPNADVLLRDIANREHDQKAAQLSGYKSRNQHTLESAEVLLNEKFSEKAIFEKCKNIYDIKQGDKHLLSYEEKSLRNINMLFDLMAGPSHHRIPKNGTIDSRKAKIVIDKKEKKFIFSNRHGRLVHRVLIPFILGCDEFKDKKIYVEPSVDSCGYFEMIYNKEEESIYLDIDGKKIKSSLNPKVDLIDVLLKRELEEVILSHAGDDYYTRTQKLLPEVEHYSDNALKTTCDRIGFDFTVKPSASGTPEIELTKVDNEKCLELYQTTDKAALKNKCFDFLSRTLSATLLDPSVIQDKKIPIPRGGMGLTLSQDANKIEIKASIEEIIQQLWHQRIPYASTVNLGPNGTILLLEHRRKKLELGGGRGGAPYSPGFSAMGETQGEISVAMKNGSGDLQRLSGYTRNDIRMNGDTFLAPWGTWHTVKGKIEDPCQSNREFTNNHQYTKCWTFKDLRDQAKKGKNIRKEFDGIECYLSMCEFELEQGLLKITGEYKKVTIEGSKGNKYKDDEIGIIRIKDISIEKARELFGNEINIVNKGNGIIEFDNVQPQQLIDAFKELANGKNVSIKPPISIDCHEFSKLAVYDQNPKKYPTNPNGTSIYRDRDTKLLLKRLNEGSGLPSNLSDDKKDSIQKEFKQEKQRINQNLETNASNIKEFSNPRKPYSGIGVKSRNSYDYNKKAWVFIITEVIPGSPAEKMGLLARDTGRGISGDKIIVKGDKSAAGLFNAIKSVRNGSNMDIEKCKSKSSPCKLSGHTSIFNFNNATNSYELFDFGLSAGLSSPISLNY